MPSPFISVIYFRKEGMIQSSHRSHAKKPESGLLSDWIGINTDDLRCSAVSCCWFQSAFFLASWAVNTYASSLWDFCQLSSLEFEECLNQSGPQPDLDIWWRHPHLQNGAHAKKHEARSLPGSLLRLEVSFPHTTLRAVTLDNEKSGCEQEMPSDERLCVLGR